MTNLHRHRITSWTPLFVIGLAGVAIASIVAFVARRSQRGAGRRSLRGEQPVADRAPDWRGLLRGALEQPVRCFASEHIEATVTLRYYSCHSRARRSNRRKVLRSAFGMR